MKARANVLNVPEEATYASEYAVLLAESVAALPETSARELRDLLCDFLAQGHTARRREARLGLLIELLEFGERASPVTQSEYEAARAERAGRGEDWPPATVISTPFGGWDQACLVALRLSRLGTGARQSADHSHGKFKGPCTHLQIADALIKCRMELGFWPYASLYFDWAGHCRRLARANGLPDPNLPGRPQFKKLVGDFERGLELAKRELARRGQRSGRPSERSAPSSAQ